MYLMRHGSVTYFDHEGRPHVPELVRLNEQGRAQAAAAGKVFSLAKLSFDRVIASGLPRTVETATMVLAETGQRVEIEHWPELEEIRGGKLASISDEDLNEAFTGAFEGVVAEHKQFLGGETIGQLIDRVFPGIERLRADHDWNTALLVNSEAMPLRPLDMSPTFTLSGPAALSLPQAARPAAATSPMIGATRFSGLMEALLRSRCRT